MNPLYKKLKTMVASPGNPDQNIFSPDKISGNPNLINCPNQTIFQVHKSGQWIYLNAEWEKLTGFSITDTLGTDIIDSISTRMIKKNPQSSLIKKRTI